jgi:hypothetical protein
VNSRCESFVNVAVLTKSFWTLAPRIEREFYQHIIHKGWGGMNKLQFMNPADDDKELVKLLSAELADGARAAVDAEVGILTLDLMPKQVTSALPPDVVSVAALHAPRPPLSPSSASLVSPRSAFMPPTPSMASRSTVTPYIAPLILHPPAFGSREATVSTAATASRDRPMSPGQGESGP